MARCFGLTDRPAWTTRTTAVSDRRVFSHLPVSVGCVKRQTHRGQAGLDPASFSGHACARGWQLLPQQPRTWPLRRADCERLSGQALGGGAM